jgi:hypothetical protein
MANIMITFYVIFSQTMPPFQHSKKIIILASGWILPMHFFALLPAFARVTKWVRENIAQKYVCTYSPIRRAMSKLIYNFKHVEK